jgi:hypothetical protein
MKTNKVKTDRDTKIMVKRWFLFHQKYDIQRKGACKGIDKRLSDTCSRLYPVDSSEPTIVTINIFTGYEVPTDAWENISTEHKYAER